MSQTITSAIVVLPLLMLGGTLLPLPWLAGILRVSLLRFLAIGAFGLYTLALLHVTLFPITIVSPGLRDLGLIARSVNLVPFANADHVSFALNVIMMVPFGFLGPVVLPRLGSLQAVALAGLAVSAAIEGTQLFMLLTLGNRRIVDIDDLIANTAGSVLGYLALVALLGVLGGVIQVLRAQPLRPAGAPRGR